MRNPTRTLAYFLLFQSLLISIKNVQAFTSSARPSRNFYYRSLCLFANQKEQCSRRDFICAVSLAAILGYSPSAAFANDDTLQRSYDTNENHEDEPLTKNSITSSQMQSALATDTTALQESISGFVSGTAVSAVKTIVKYPLDTATVRLQMPGTSYSLRNLPELFSGSFDGISGPLLSNIPAGAIFFAVKDAIKTSIKGVGLPKWASTSLAVAAALPPYWAIRNPSEVIKTRLQVGVDGYNDINTMEAFQLTLSQGNITSLYQGYNENILYGFPADVIKFIAYDYLSGGRKDLSAANGAMYGAISTGIAQLVTTPLDVARNRIMAEVNKDDGSDSPKENYVVRLAKIAEEEGAAALFAGTTPRIAKAMLSGALQFAAYEETKQKVTEMFVRR
jgi:solute carrier family 25 S-adenosylmethionine transporter 26